MISKQFSIEINREKLSEQNDSNIIPSLAQFSSVVQLCLENIGCLVSLGVIWALIATVID